MKTGNENGEKERSHLSAEESVLIIQCNSNVHLLDRQIAGLTYLERMTQNARKIGIGKVMVMTAPRERHDSNKQPVLLHHEMNTREELTAKTTILVKCGYLPDPSAFASIRDNLKLQKRSAKSIFLVQPARTLQMDGSNSEPCLYTNPDSTLKQEHILYDAKRLKGYLLKGKVYDIAEPGMPAAAEKHLFQGLLKEDEGFMSKHFERKVSTAISKRLVKTAISPNQITAISILIGLCAALLIGIGQGLWQIIGSLLFLFHSILDGCDGEIARIKFMESRWGGLLDFWGDNIVHSFIWMAIAWEWWGRTFSYLPIVLACIATCGGLASAACIYWNTMRNEHTEGPHYKSVSAVDKKGMMKKIIDYLTRRDFIYLAVLMSIFRHLDWFLWVSAVGTPIFLAALIYIQLRGKFTFLSHNPVVSETNPNRP